MQHYRYHGTIYYKHHIIFFLSGNGGTHVVFADFYHNIEILVMTYKQKISRVV